MRSKDLAKFIIAREAHRVMREQGEDPTAWKNRKRADPIITKYRFCNVVRADDRVTKFIFDWAQAWDGHEHQWFAFVVARLFNRPDTLEDLAGAVVPFKPRLMRDVLLRRKGRGQKNFNAAYIVSTNGIAMDKVDYIIDRVLAPLWAARKAMRPRLLTSGDKHSPNKSLMYESLDSWHTRLQGAQGLGSFMAAQIVADLKYFPPFFSRELGIPTSAFEDWWTFAASGPGSRRGLNRIFGIPADKGWNERQWRNSLAELIAAARPLLPASIGSRLTAQDWQNCLCEFDKYERARLGEQPPKQLYTPHEEKK